MAGRVNDSMEVKLARIEENLKNLTQLMKDGFEAIDRRLRDEFVRKDEFESIKIQVSSNTKSRNWTITFFFTTTIGLIGSLIAFIVNLIQK